MSSNESNNNRLDSHFNDEPNRDFPGWEGVRIPDALPPELPAQGDDLSRKLHEQISHAEGATVPGADPPPLPEYEETEEGIIWNKETKDGYAQILLANFHAMIREYRVFEDGRRTYVIAATLVASGAEKEVEVSCEDFGKLAWVTKELGPAWIVEPGQTLRTATAIRKLSGQPRQVTVFTTLGWHDVPGGEVYAHADSIIGKAENIEVEMGESVKNYKFQATTPDVDAIRASLSVLEVAPDRITFPLLASVFRAVLGPCEFSVLLTGSTGNKKSSLAALAQQHFGAGMDRLHLPGNWGSTANKLEVLAHKAKDALVVIDEFRPQGSGPAAQAVYEKADLILMAQGNGAGKGRLRSDLSEAQVTAPQSLILMTGEGIPRGEAVLGRLLVLEVGKESVKLDLLTVAQDQAKAGTLARALASFIASVAGQRNEFLALVDVLRENFIRPGQHPRLSGILADLCVGFTTFVAFARETGAVSCDKADELMARCRAALFEAGNDQGDVRESDPVRMFLSNLETALVSGKANVAAASGGEPSNPHQWGWSGGKPRGKRIGFIEDDFIYLEPDMAYTRCKGTGLREVPIPLDTLMKRLRDAGLIEPEPRGKSFTLTVRRRFDGVQRKFLKLRVSAIFPPSVADPDIDAGDGVVGGAA